MFSIADLVSQPIRISSIPAIAITAPKAAYASVSPEVTQALRDVYFVHDSYFVIADSVDAAAPGVQLS